MPRRKQPKTVQLKLRFDEATRAEVEATADRRGISMNAEIVDRIESGIAINALGEGWFGISDLARFRDYAQVVKLGTKAAGVEEANWLRYARHVPFPIDTNDRAAVQNANAAILQAVNEDVKKYREAMRDYLSRHGQAPDQNSMRRRPHGSIARDAASASDEDAAFRYQQKFVKDVAANRARRATVD